MSAIANAVEKVIVREIVEAGKHGIVLDDLLTRARRHGWTPKLARETIDRLERRGGVELRDAGRGVTIYSSEPLSDLIAQHIASNGGTASRWSLHDAFPNRSSDAISWAVTDLSCAGRADLQPGKYGNDLVILKEES